MSSSPVVWSLLGKTHSGALRVDHGRITLTGREQTLSFPVAAIVGMTIERGPARRLRGLASLAVQLEQGDVVTIASLAGVGSLRDVLASIEDEQELVADRLIQSL